MGYYTSHELEIVSGSSNTTDYYKEGISNTTNYGAYGCFDDEIKWYDHEADMKAFSKKHPNALFKLIGDGEENGDQWHEYHQNGKMQRCKAIISFPDYNESEMK